MIVSKDITWHIRLSKCPHCGVEIEQEFQSCISQKVAFEYLFKSMNLHIQNNCNKVKSKKFKIGCIKKVRYQGSKSIAQSEINYHHVII